MLHEIKVPAAGESVTEAYIGTWRKNNGDIVKKGEILVDLESQKATFELEADFSGKLQIIVSESGATVTVGDIIATIDDSASGSATPQTPSAPSGGVDNSHDTLSSPSVRKLMTELNVSADNIQGSGKNGRITKDDVLNRQSPASVPAPVASATTSVVTSPSAPSKATVIQVPVDTTRGDRVVKAPRIRQQIAKNLVQAQHTAAILTTFNEVDMTAIMAYRKANKEKFKAEHGVNLGMVGFFALAASQALQEFPLVNSYFDGQNIVYHDYVDLSVAVSTEKGLVVPVMRHVEKMSLVDFERSLMAISTKARDGKLSIPEMTGGTFTITNGGVFGSMLSTPILNMPQAAILGLHNIVERPVVIDGKIEIRPIMYVALSYDHRIIDGKEAVQTLVKIKKLVEDLSWVK